MGMSAIGSNAFLSNALGALVEVPPYFVLVPLLDPWGRRPLFTLSLLFTAISCFGAAASPQSSAIMTAFALTGKFLLRLVSLWSILLLQSFSPQLLEPRQ